MLGRRGPLQAAFTNPEVRELGELKGADIHVFPEEVRLDRPAATGMRHLAFGYGNHACIGLHLARAEARIALETLLPRMEDIAPGSENPIARLENFMLRGPTRLELGFRPRQHHGPAEHVV